MAVGYAYCVSWPSHTSTNINFFPKPLTIFLTCFSRGEGPKNTGKKFHLNRVSNSQPPGHESDTLTTEPPMWGRKDLKNKTKDQLKRQTKEPLKIGQDNTIDWTRQYKYHTTYNPEFK